MDSQVVTKGCKTCGRSYWGLDGTIQCKFDPHNTDPNGSIAHWLRNESDPWEPVSICPAWENWREHQTVA